MSTSYTARRLETATPEHLDITTRRTFIGPVPAGWLRSHRKQWYKDFSLNLTKRPSLRADEPGFDGAAESREELPQTVVTPATPPHPIEPQPFDPEVTRDGSEIPETRPHAEATRGDNEASETRPHDIEASRGNSEARELISTTSATSLLHSQHAASQRTSHDAHATRTTPRVRFSEASRLQIRARARRLASKTGLRSSDIKEGTLLKVDKMLVRIDISQQHLTDYDERISQGVETRTLEKWREYMIVCRKHSDGDAAAVLQLYQTRVIAATEDRKVKVRPKKQIPLSQSRAKINLFSSLDKTLCLWTSKNGRTTIYYLKPELSATSVEWYSFIRAAMGLPRQQNLSVSVPDLRITLQLSDPFRTSQVEQEATDVVEGDDAAIAKALGTEAGAARAIISRCTDILQTYPEWKDVLKLWPGHDHVGLAWKRYDRLEWVHGSIEQRMYGTLAMSRTHDLELRSMVHSPTKLGTGPSATVEPRAVEGFLIQLSTQSGATRRFGKLLFKRLYFTTQDRYLVFLRPARATPPPPPKLRVTDTGDVPTTKQLTQETPLMYDVDPYDSDRLHQEDRQACDKYAEADANRQTSMLLASDGFVDLCDVKDIQVLQSDAIAEETGVDTGGEDVDFDAEVPDQADPDGKTEDVDEDRIFELVMRNGLVIRLQAFSRAMRGQWMKRLRDLVNYWTQRTKEELNMYKSVRQQNLKTLGIDERAEAVVGQFAYKWEVSQSFASPSLYNVCGLSRCRAIAHAGVLYRKPRRHTTFTRNHVLLVDGHMLMYQDTLRKRSGRILKSVHHERIASIDLQGCYLYSGLLTEDDLLYQNQTYDSNNPGHHSLPRMYLEDGWTSTDEDSMTTFVLWRSKTKSWFKSSKTLDDVKESQVEKGKAQTKLTRIAKLGTAGSSIVFTARSRAERDHWVLAIQNEIERLGASIDEEIRLS